jgi:hypothetical protein
VKKRRHYFRKVEDPPPRDTEGMAEAERQLALSQKLLQETEQRVIEPLKEMQRRNNVTGVVRKLVKKEPDAGGASSS